MFDMEFTDGVMEKVLSGCPNLEYLVLKDFSGIYHLEISSVKLRELIIHEYKNENHDLELELFAPYIKKLQIVGLCSEIRIINVASLVTVMLCLDFDFYLGKNRTWRRKLVFLMSFFKALPMLRILRWDPGASSACPSWS